MRVWITGAGGMLGQDVVSAMHGPSVLSTDREVDITDPVAVNRWWESSGGIDWVVNCAAYTAVDRAESEESIAMHLNSEGPRVLATAAATRGAALLHISTDYVFSGDATVPYLPEQMPAPRSAYGRTKLAGENVVRSIAPHHIILRTAWLYGAGGSNFVQTMVRLMNSGKEFGVVADQRGLPTASIDLARAIAHIVTQKKASWGTYHYTNAGSTPEEDRSGISWFDFAQQIYLSGSRTGIIHEPPQFSPLRTDQYPTAAVRPSFSVLDSSATESMFGVNRPRWQESLDEFISNLEIEQ